MHTTSPLPKGISIRAGKLSAGPGREAQSRLARQLLRGLGEWRIERDGDGRPVALTADGGPGPDVSIAHSGLYAVVAAVSWGRVGVDVEGPRPGRDWRAIAEAYLSDAERACVDAEGEPALLAFWTLREAVAKAAGGGMARALSLDGTAVARARGGTGRILVDGVPCLVAQRAWGGLQWAAGWIGGTDEAALAAELAEACASIHSAI